MRIVIDMQAVQSTGSRQRGIGRYALSFVRALWRQRGAHDIILLFNGLLAETIPAIHAEFAHEFPLDSLKIWDAPGPLHSAEVKNGWRRRAAELVREAYLLTLQVDFVLVLSLFEGLDDDAVVSLGRLPSRIPHAVIVYDLIPYLYPHLYLTDARVAAWYAQQLAYLQQAELLLTISSSCQREVLTHLSSYAGHCVSISAAVDAHFQPRQYSKTDEQVLRARYGLTQAFIMYTGGIDPRKNIEGLIAAFAALPDAVRASHQLAIVCRVSAARQVELMAYANSLGLLAGQLVLTGFVPDDDLLALYNLCTAFVFPSLHEGFGLPILEAMACGRAVIAANNSSLPEVLGYEEALFEPNNPEAIAAKLLRVLTDESFRETLEQHARRQSKHFSWENTASLALKACEKYLRPSNMPRLAERPEELLLTALLNDKSAPRDAWTWMKLAKKIARVFT